MKNQYPLQWIQTLKSGFKKQSQFWKKLPGNSYQQQIRKTQEDHFSQLLKKGFSSIKNLEDLLNSTELFVQTKPLNNSSKTYPVSSSPFAFCEFLFSSPQVYTIHFHNGRLVSHPSGSLLPKWKWGTWEDMDEIFPSSQWIARQLLKGGCDSFCHLASALPVNGYVLFVPEKCRDNPYIHVHFSFDELTKPSSFWNLRNFIFLEEHTNVTLIETVATSSSSSHFVNSVTDIKISPNSVLKRLQINSGGPTNIHFNQTRCEMEQSTDLYNLMMDLNTGYSRDEMEVHHLGKKAKSTLSNLQIVKKQESREQKYRVYHLKKEGYSRHFSRGILNDSSKNVFYGNVYVDGKAAHTDCGQSVKNLLLNPNAFACMQPELQIDCSEVQAQHGATAGHLNEDDVFYLQSRGLDKKSAFELLLFTYIQDVLNTFPSLELMKQLKQYIQNNRNLLLNL